MERILKQMEDTSNAEDVLNKLDAILRGAGVVDLGDDFDELEGEVNMGDMGDGLDEEFKLIDGLGDTAGKEIGKGGVDGGVNESMKGGAGGDGLEVGDGLGVGGGEEDSMMY
ncbi:hypothetical protein HDU76_002912 [Blyttiomyces sp. JEL0837]|nr:hypothetical protein HDU76_002912 [Blyttiomyces sp. JEL0837]